jgi:geranylgeranyl pyrophosphate synthase
MPHPPTYLLKVLAAEQANAEEVSFLRQCLVTASVQTEEDRTRIMQIVHAGDGINRACALRQQHVDAGLDVLSGMKESTAHTRLTGLLQSLATRA